MSNPVIILGAGRSGTKFLRGLLAAHPDFRAVPFDVNHVWISNARHNIDDEVRPEHLSERAKLRVRDRLFALARIKKRLSQARLVEKTVSNTLRVPLVDHVFPDALIIHIIRDGRDVVESASRVWRLPVGARYAASKIRCFAAADASYLLRGIANAAKSRQGTSMWGPRYRGYQTDLASQPIPVVAARQWKACVESTLESLSTIDASRQHTVRYEDLVACSSVVEGVASFIGCDASPLITTYRETVQRGRVGSHKNLLGTEAQDAAHAELSPLLERLGYDTHAVAA